MVLGREGDQGCYGAVDGDEYPPDYHAARNGKHMILGPVVRHQCSLAEDRQEDGCVQGSAPHPMTGDLAVTLNEITVPDQFSKYVENDGVVNGVGYPLDEILDLE
jgi:hypothetical protein